MSATLDYHPTAEEHIAYYGKYITLVDEPDVLAALATENEKTTRLLGAVAEADAGFRYAPEKWSIRQVVGHLSDVERVFAYRALRVARADMTPLPGFDENAYAEAAAFDRRTLADLVADFRSVRQASLTLFRGFEPAAFTRIGVANAGPISVRALLCIIVGHERHHVGLLRSRYGLKG
jgi:uncharacterized damage-inducible protein DinB